MYRFVFTAIVLFGSSSLIRAQVVGNPGWSVGRITFDSCTVESSSRDFVTLGNIPYGTDIEFGPDGELFLLSPIFGDSSLVDGRALVNAITELDYRTNTPRNVIFTDSVARSGEVFTSLGNNGTSQLIAAVSDTLVSIHSKTGRVTVIGLFNEADLKVDLAVVNGSTVYPTNVGDSLPGFVVFENNNPGNVQNVIQFSDMSFSAGLGTVWSDDCSEKYLVCTTRERVETGFWRTRPQLRRVNETLDVVQEGCAYDMDVSNLDVGFGSFFGIASYDNYISVCELRIDLDTDDSGSRFGPHFWQDAECTTSYPVADTDVSVRSLVGAIDSVTVKLRTAGSQPGFDRLLVPFTDNLLVRNFGDTLLHLVNTGAATEIDFLALLPAITLEVTAPEVITGERIIETYVYAGGLRSDQARSFIQVDPSTGSNAGCDTTVIMCLGGQVDLLEALGPGTTPGGSWFPFIPENNRWVFGEALYDVPYRYIVGGAACGYDTSFVTVTQPQPIKPFLPVVDTTIALCAGETFFWDVNLPDREIRVFWDDGTFETVREINAPGFYTGSVRSTVPCQPSESISLTVVADTPPPQTFGTELFCRGDTVTLANGGIVTADSSVTVAFSGEPWACDSLHTTNYRFTEQEMVTLRDTFCTGDKIVIRGEVFEEPGEYLLSVPGEVCDTLFEILLAEAMVDTVVVDTTLLAGEVLELAGQVFTEADTFQVLSFTEGRCGTYYDISLDFSTSVRDYRSVELFWHPSLLRAGRDALEFHAAAPSVSVQLLSVKVFDSFGRKVGESAGEWSPGAGVVPGIYFFTAKLLVNNQTVRYTSKLLVTSW